ncbi:hypothetical protein PAXRUDRAFT_132726 [Paxillus rubicundulus Ve08.2h10]|uniref:Uncharacterized protein n=1 Tax=Paxillus rubicundulus Ve08.2h10 TaxID=930991 RepID=A0A0D0E944_9AGAM|nr:hypothetical protein PAXRUDRAFT_132726 [Paxillus rubicundulus Ve08.2h10]
MSSHGDLVKKRSPAQAHRHLAARYSPTDLYTGEGASTTQPPPAGEDPADGGKTLSSVRTTSSATPTVAPATTTPSTSTASPSTIATSSLTSSSTSSSTTSSSTFTSTTPLPFSAAVPTLKNTTPNAVPTTSIKVVTGAATPTLSPSATPTSTSSVSTSAIVGGIAGTLLGIAVLGFFIMWCMRRQRNRDADDFDADAFKRQSAILVDDAAMPPRSYNPRPPTMIERHNASPALAAQTAQNLYGNYSAYGQQQAPYATNQHGSSPPPQAYGQQPVMGYSAYDDPRQLSRQPSNGAYLTRQPTIAPAYGPSFVPVDPNAHYVDLSRSSVTPYQATQYADISRHLGTSDPNEQATQPINLPDGPLPSPFDDHVEAAAGAPPAVSPEVPAPQLQGNTTDPMQRPTSSYSVYEDGDAYGGI